VTAQNDGSQHVAFQPPKPLLDVTTPAPAAVPVPSDAEAE
jgi:hypothetical protein